MKLTKTRDHLEIKRHIFRHLVLPTHDTLFKRRRTFHYLRGLQQSQWLSLEAHEERQLAALRDLVGHASDTCPYYRERWNARGLSTHVLKSLADFEQWPLIDRGTIRRHREQMRSSHSTERLISKATGGSTGTPLRFDLNRDSHDRRVAASYRGYEWAGATVGTKQFYLWGVPLGKQSRWQLCKDQVYNWIHRRHVFNSFELQRDTVPLIAEQLARQRPDVIVAYTGALYTLAREFQNLGISPYLPSSIVVGAEKLHDFQRELIERVFSAPVFETYGSREFMLIGAECERREGLHLTMEHLLVEILDDDGKPTPEGEEGNVVITDLFNFGMPFVRYLTGDRAVAGLRNCSCGRGLPLLKSVIGRQLDVITTPDERRIPGEFFPHLIKDFPAVQRFQVTQAAPDRIELRVVLSPAWRETDELQLRRAITPVIGPNTTLCIVPVDSIPLTRTGKHRVVVNLVAGSDEESLVTA